MSNFIPDPLHPAVVHLPIALAVLLPFFVAGSLCAIHRGIKPARAWLLTTALLGLLAVSAAVAVQTGEAQSDRVAQTVGEATVDQHEEAGEAFLITSALVFAASLAGLAGGLVGRLARGATVLGVLTLFIAVWLVGHSGGAIVYHPGSTIGANPTTITPTPSGHDRE
jgi:formate hydrogenlyase subunit 3/multisubunit Na+/H+ antiporter MnhD subunit